MANDVFDFTDTMEVLYDEATAEVQNFSIDVLDGVIAQSRVDTGRMRGNWVVGIDQVPIDEREPLRSGPRRSAARENANGERALSEGTREIATFDLEDNNAVVIRNNTEYVEIWNERDSITTIALAGAEMK